MLPSTPKKTPVKPSRTVNLSPNSKTTRCILCNKYESNPDYRRKLQKGGVKTAACVLMETTLEVNVGRSYTTDIVG